MKTQRTLTPLEDAALRTLVACSEESDGWLDLARVSSRTGRQLMDVRQAVARLVRFGLVHIVDTAPDNTRWVQVEFPSPAESDSQV